MRFGLNIMGVELFSFEFAWPSKGVYPVPDFYDMPTEEEILDLGLFNNDDDD